ncbi:hypothetical protein JCM6882_008849 [Rhodosporidiobolus microsporus]
MPSFKACLLAVATAALAFAPVDASATHTRREAAAASLDRRAVDRTGLNKGQYKTKSAFLQTAAALAVARIRCGTDAVCAARGDPPANGAAVCITGRCTFRCNEGFAPGGADGTECVAAASACSGVTCNVPDNGYATCDATTGACIIGCDAGFTRYSLSNPPAEPYFCFATSTDPNNCGLPGNVCPGSYNGIGDAACKSGNCRIQCPAGSFLRRAASTTNPFYCYNGEDSLGPAAGISR